MPRPIRNGHPDIARRLPESDAAYPSIEDRLNARRRNPLIGRDDTGIPDSSDRGLKLKGNNKG